MPPDSSATKTRILAAALGEFSAFGLAGARVDRIADAGHVNKRSIYVHFGNKEELFDIVVARSLEDLAADVDFTADDLPSYAGRLFDYLLSRPEVLRLSTWANLERPHASLSEGATYLVKIESIRAAQTKGTLRGNIEAVDLLALVLGLITSWAAASPALRSQHLEDPQSTSRLGEHRAAMVAAVRGLCLGP